MIQTGDKRITVETRFQSHLAYLKSHMDPPGFAPDPTPRWGMPATDHPDCI